MLSPKKPKKQKRNQDIIPQQYIFFNRHCHIDKNGVESIRSHNAVTVTKLGTNMKKSHLARLFMPAKPITTNLFKKYDNASVTSPFTNAKYVCKNHGTLMYFSQNKKLTRIGPHCHADSLNGAYHFWYYSDTPLPIRSIDTNNLVFGLSFQKTFNYNDIKDHPRHHQSEEFPAATIKYTKTGNTVEFYKSGKINITGNPNPQNIARTITEARKYIETKQT